MPDFSLTNNEAQALAQYVRRASTGKIGARFPDGNAARGKAQFVSSGCHQCHPLSGVHPGQPQLDWKPSMTLRGCLAAPSSAPNRPGVPAFHFTEAERQALMVFVQNDLTSLRHSSDVETSARLFKRLQCANCHDRDGQRSHRRLVIAEEGTGQLPEVLPSLTWAGEKLKPDWTRRLLAGQLSYKPRPWSKTRMPAFAGYAAIMAHGLAAEHAVDPHQRSRSSYDAKLASIGEKLSMPTGLDCRQCHAIGDLQPRGDQQTQIALGINFTHIRDRLRREAYDRFMLDPPRYDINTRMIRLSENGVSTKLREYFDADARQQFAAVWHYIQSLPSE